MQPFLKWAGGKEKELKYIVPALPGDYVDYYEPFVGGGSVFAALQARHSYINDLSVELASFYQAIAARDADFFRYARLIDRAWSNAGEFFDRCEGLTALYGSYRAGAVTDERMVAEIDAFCLRRHDEIVDMLPEALRLEPEELVAELASNLRRKLKRMKKLEQEKHALPPEDIADNILTAVKSALYMYFRGLYNDRGVAEGMPHLHQALFLFIRNYCYSGMFRYNADGEFNVPYGGIAYNSKSLKGKLDYYESAEVARRMEGTVVCNLDFEEFFMEHEPHADDFVFLDPPYDSEFSTYAGNEFGRADHERLADYLLHRCQARWMLVIKYTDFIHNLYNQPGINIRRFNKEYLVSFMNRNDRSAIHLLITNY